MKQCITWSSLQRYGMTIFFCLLVCTTWYTWWYRKTNALLMYYKTQQIQPASSSIDIQHLKHIVKDVPDIIQIMHRYPVQVKECKQLALKNYPWCRSFLAQIHITGNFFNLWHALESIHNVYDMAFVKNCSFETDDHKINYTGEIKLYTHWRLP